MGIILLLFQTSIFTDPYDMQLPLLSRLAELFVLLAISTIVVLQSQTVSDKVTNMLEAYCHKESRKSQNKLKGETQTFHACKSLAEV